MNQKLSKQDTITRTHQIVVARSKGYTLEEIAGVFGITRERVRQLYKPYRPLLPDGKKDVVKLSTKMTKKCANRKLHSQKRLASYHKRKHEKENLIP